MSRRDRYPRKGEHGSSGVSCGWCGKFLPGERPNEGGNYCSFECSAAGKYYSNICVGLILIAFVILIIQFSVQQFLEHPSIAMGNLLFVIGAIIVLGFILIYCAVSIREGYRIRKAEEESRWKIQILDNENDLTPLHRQILEYVMEFPANEGITRRQIIERMEEYRTLPSDTKNAIGELVLAGFLEELSIGRYCIGERDFTGQAMN